MRCDGSATRPLSHERERDPREDEDRERRPPEASLRNPGSSRAGGDSTAGSTPRACTTPVASSLGGVWGRRRSAACSRPRPWSGGHQLRELGARAGIGAEGVATALNGAQHSLPFDERVTRTQFHPLAKGATRRRSTDLFQGDGHRASRWKRASGSRDRPRKTTASSCALAPGPGISSPSTR